MTKSSYGLAMLMTGWGASAAAAPVPGGAVTAEEAMRHYHETFGIPATRGCDDAVRSSDEDIVVCGGPKRRYRLPLPIERERGEIVRHVNEPDAVGALASPCFRGCDASGVDVLKIVRAAPKIVRHILGHDD